MPVVPSSVQSYYQSFIAHRLAHLPPAAIDRSPPSLEEWRERAPALRSALKRILGFPPGHTPDQPVRWEIRGTIPGDGYRIERIVYEAETDPPSWVTALLYIPEWPAERGLESEHFPALVLACGHGGSKSSLYNQYACQLYAHLGCVVLLPDPIGEEERHPAGGLGHRGHREANYLDLAMGAGRPIVGKMVFDLVRGIDLLRSHPLVDPARIGCAGSSLGGTVTQFLAAVEERLALCLNSAWVADYRRLDGEKGCCWRLPSLMHHVNQAEMIALAAPHCAYLVMAGGIDEICPPAGAAEMVEAARRVYALFGAGERCRFLLNPATGHQPYHIAPHAVEWLTRHLGATPSWQGGPPPPLVTIGDLAARHGMSIEPLYNVERHHKGAVTYDVGLVWRDPVHLRVLDDEERLNGDYTLPRWLEAIERALPRTPDPRESAGAFARWWTRAEARREALRALLDAAPVRVAWGPGVPVPLAEVLPEGEAVGEDAGGQAGGEAGPENGLPTEPPPGTEAFLHPLEIGCTEPGCAGRLQLPAHQALLLRPPRRAAPGPDPAAAVVYLPRARDWRRADRRKLVQWLAEGRDVMILSCARLFDDELLAGTSATAFNTALVRAAVDLLADCRPGVTITCHGEVDDVAAWAGALDRRVEGIEVRSRGGAEPSVMGAKRKEGVVAGRLALVDQVGLWALTLPRRVDVAETVSTSDERGRLDAIRAYVSQGAPQPAPERPPRGVPTKRP